MGGKSALKRVKQAKRAKKQASLLVER